LFSERLFLTAAQTTIGREGGRSEVQRAPVQEGTAQPITPRAAERVISPPHHSTSPANDDRKPAIVTTNRFSNVFADLCCA
jgi:hypothetical protein